MEPGTIGTLALQYGPSILDGLFGGGGGGAKPQTVWWNYGGTSVGFGDENITSQDPAFYAATAGKTNALIAEFGLDRLRAIPTFSMQAPPGAAPFDLLAEMERIVMEQLRPAAIAQPQPQQQSAESVSSVAPVSQFSQPTPAQQSSVAPGIVSSALEAVSSPFVIFGALIVLAFAVYSFSRR